MLKLIPVLGALFIAAPAQAHYTHHYYPHHHGVWVSWHSGPRPRQPKIRIDEHCVYKPWKDKVVCKY